MYYFKKSLGEEDWERRSGYRGTIPAAGLERRRMAEGWEKN